MKISGFCDLNICISSDLFKSTCIDHVLAMGYKTIALNTIVADSSSEKSKKKKGQVKDGVPLPQSLEHIKCKSDNAKKYDIISVVPSSTTALQEMSGGLQVLNRLTIHFSDSNQLQKFCKSDNAKKYDIISVVPSSTTALQLACACKDIDVISFNASERPLMMNRKAYNLAVSNSIYFEVPYAPAISDSGLRRNTIQVAHEYHSYGKSKNIVLASGAKEIRKIRGPYDVINLALLFGLSEEQAKHSMLNTSRALILRAEGRRHGRTAMTMMITDLDLDSEEESDEEPVAKKPKSGSTSETKMLLDL